MIYPKSMENWFTINNNFHKNFFDCFFIEVEGRPIYSLSLSEQDKVKRQVTELWEKGFIRPSSSPYGPRVLLVKKKRWQFKECENIPIIKQKEERNLNLWKKSQIKNKKKNRSIHYWIPRLLLFLSSSIVVRLKGLTLLYIDMTFAKTWANNMIFLFLTNLLVGLDLFPPFFSAIFFMIFFSVTHVFFNFLWQ